MANILARGQISIIDLNDAKSLNMYLNSNQPTTQIYNTDTKSFSPDWAKDPKHLVITPELYVSGTGTNQISRLKGKPRYIINGDDRVENWGSVSPTSPYALTITKNALEAAPQMRVQCVGIYVDPNIPELETQVQAEIQFTKSTNAGSTIMAIGTTPQGFIFKNDQVENLLAHCDMWRGSSIDTTDVTYSWFKMGDVGQWLPMSPTGNMYGCTIKPEKPNELLVHKDAVVNFEAFKCVCTDTDVSSVTHGTGVPFIFTFRDESDPFSVETYSTTGDKLLNGQGSTTIAAKIWRAGVCFSEKDAKTRFTLKWKKYDIVPVSEAHPDGVKQDTSWGTGGVKEGMSITVDASEVTQKATFICELYDNKA